MESTFRTFYVLANALAFVLVMVTGLVIGIVWAIRRGRRQRAEAAAAGAIAEVPVAPTPTPPDPRLVWSDPPPPPPGLQFVSSQVEEEWRTAIAGNNDALRDQAVDRLITALTPDDISVLLSRIWHKGEGADLARGVFYRLTHGDDPRFIDTAAYTLWDRLVSFEHTQRWDTAVTDLVSSPLPDVNGTLPMDCEDRFPIWDGGFLALGPGEVPCRIRAFDPLRLQSGDDSDRVRLRVTVPADDGTVWEWNSVIDMRQMFDVLLRDGERDDRRFGECFVPQLVVRDDTRSTVTLSASCFDKTLDFSVYRKHLSFHCDVIALRGGPGAAGVRTPDRLGLRLLPHSYAARNAERKTRPMPAIQYSYRAISSLMRPYSPPSWGGVQPQAYFEQKPEWREDDEFPYLDGPRARVLRD